MRFDLSALACAALVGAAAPLSAQSVNDPFQVNMDRVSTKEFGANYGDSKTYIVPSYDLILAAHGDIWAQKSGAQAHGKFHVDGLDPAFLRGIASTLQADFVGKLREAGYTVITYDDIKDEPDVVKRDREGINDVWKLPIKRLANLMYVIVAPTEAQQFDHPITGINRPLRDLAKAKDAIVIHPELTFTAPLMYGQTREGYRSAEAGINTDPAMRLAGVLMNGMNAKGGTANIVVLEHGTRLASENVGTFKKLSSDSYEFSKEWKRTSGDFSFTIDRALYEKALLRVGTAVNTMVVERIKKAH